MAMLSGLEEERRKLQRFAEEDVVVNFDHNMLEQSISEEAVQGSEEQSTEPNWFGSATDDEDNVSIECGYESVD